MLEVRNVSKLYENQRGVQRMDFTMQRGEIVGFLGPNGAGKTTTMRMITGYLLPNEGTISVDGHIMAEHPREAKRKIGYLPETPPLYMDMTVHSYLKFIADLRDIPFREQKQRVGDVMDRLGLIGREGQVIRSLSKGYKQRLGLAQAIVHSPDLLVLDEPTSGLDPKQIAEIRQLIRELGERHTVLLSTHILPEVNSICNRVLIINQGRLVLDEHPDRIGLSAGNGIELELEIKGPKESIEKTLQSVPGIERIDWMPFDVGAFLSTEDSAVTTGIGNDHDVVRCTVRSREVEDIRAAVFFALAAEGLPILEMKRRVLSLEDVFLKLTTEEAVADA